MNKQQTLFSLLFTLLFIPAISQNKKTVSINDFNNIIGKWVGSLTYLDYSSGKPFTMPANVAIAKNAINNQEIIFSLQYPDEPKANGNDTLAINVNGKMIDNETVISNGKTADGAVEIITEKLGIDGNDNRKALIRHIYSFTNNLFVKRKEVKFDGEEKWILRNEYKFSR